MSSPAIKRQRVKLVSKPTTELPSFGARRDGIVEKNRYILEEPTIGLYLGDCERLIALHHRLVDPSHTVLVIEHHTDIIAEADHHIEIGPDGGEAGGQLIFSGPVEASLNAPTSITAPYLRPHLSPAATGRGCGGRGLGALGCLYGLGTK